MAIRDRCHVLVVLVSGDNPDIFWGGELAKNGSQSARNRLRQSRMRRRR